MHPDAHATSFDITDADCVFTRERMYQHIGENMYALLPTTRCTHTASGATAVSRPYGEDGIRRVDAFRQMIAQSKFSTWVRTESIVRMGKATDIVISVKQENRGERVWAEVYERGTRQAYMEGSPS